MADRTLHGRLASPAGTRGTQFPRRITLLGALITAATLGLAAQMFRLSVVQGAVHRGTAEKRLDLVRYLETLRGRILDRRGRVLAEDRPGHDVAIDYEVITGAWALQKARAEARRADRRAWARMDDAQRHAAVEARLPARQADVEELWAAVMRLGAIDRPDLDRRLDSIKSGVEKIAAAVLERRVREGADQAPRVQPVREQQQAHVVLPGVSREVAFEFRRLAERLAITADGRPGIVVRDVTQRVHPWGTVQVTIDREALPQPLRSEHPATVEVAGVADHVLGAMRDDVWAEELERRPFHTPQDARGVDLEGYRLGDAVGARGLERSFEDHLRGSRGVLLTRLDTGEAERRSYVPGSDLHLTLDIALQARIQAIMSPELGLARVHQWQAGWDASGAPRPLPLPAGTPLDGAAVVIDVDSGDILAMVSTPTVAMGRALPAPCRSIHQPWLNRGVEAIYPPGSIAKPIALLAAASEGEFDRNSTIECTGHYLAERDDILRCWCYRAPSFLTHGSLGTEEALARSCNIFFYTLGERLGLARLSSWFARFGVGRPYDIGLLYAVEGPGGTASSRGEAGGTLPEPGELESMRASGELRFASIIMGTGQGPVTWTPLHAAQAFATIARGGRYLAPTLVRRAGGSSAPLEHMTLDESLVATIMEGLRASVAEPHGTGNHIAYPTGTSEPLINARGVTVWAKTGTAQAPPASFDLDCDGVAETRVDDGSHAWFVGLVGPGPRGVARPRFAIAVIFEYGGSGGRAAGPVANQVILALQAEGYLAGGQP
jgi:penicillin-binding protein 2